MKTIRLLTIFLFVSNFQFIQAQDVWIPLDVTLPDSFGVWDFSIVNEDVIWATATNWYLDNQSTNIPMFLLSIDGGDNWEVGNVSEAMGGAALNIQAINKDTALITTHTLEGFPSTRKIFKTIDGGNSWTEVLNAGCGGWNLHFFDSHWIANCWQVGICYSDDEGSTWNPISNANYPAPIMGEGTNIQSSLTNSYPVVGNTLWFGSTKGRIIRSTDQGMNWNLIHYFGGNTNTPSLAFSDTDNGLCVYYNGNDCDLYRTDDGGDTWDAIVLPSSIVLQEITHIPGTDSTFVGVSWGDPVLTAITHDFGVSWNILDDSISISSLSFYSNSFGLAAEGTGLGNLPAIYKFDPLILSSNARKLSQSIKVSPNPFQEKLFIDFEELSVKEVALINLSGQVFWVQQSNNQRQMEISIPEVTPGIYFLKVKTKGGVAYKKLIKM